MASLTVLRLRCDDVALIERQLRAKVAQMPQFFQDAPVAVDFAGVGGGSPDFPFEALALALRAAGVVPVAVANLDESARPAARAAGLGLLQASPMRPREAAPAAGGARVPAATAQGAAAHHATGAAGQPVARPALPPQPPPLAMGHRPAVVVRQPVRGGQVVYAQQTDLIVMAPVNPGAQVIADGHVHIYATLRGRAMAGAQGMADARIYCQRLEAELVAIAGAYVLADDIPVELRGKAAQVLVEAGECRIQPL